MRFKQTLTSNGLNSVEKVEITFTASSWQAADRHGIMHARKMNMDSPSCSSIIVYADEPTIPEILAGKDARRPLMPSDIAAWTAEDIAELEGTMADRELETGIVKRRFQIGMAYENGAITREKAMADLIGSGLTPAKTVRRLDAIDFKTVGEVRE
jgi:hypothetical protein